MAKEIKISVYEKFATDEEILNTNGLAILDNICIKAETIENISTGNYILDCVFLQDNEGLYKYLKEENILKVKMDYDDELFVITKCNPNLNEINITGRQITIEEERSLWLEDVRPTETDGQATLRYLLDNSIADNRAKRLQVHSDIGNKATSYYEKMSLYDAIHTCDQSFINRWGGEVKRRGFNLYLNQQIGEDNGVNIRYKKNLISLERDSNLDTLITKAQGKGYNGIYGNWIESPLINNYNKVYRHVFEYQDVKVRTENMSENEEGMIFDTLQQAQEELDRRVKLEFSKNNVDKIKATFTVKHVDLLKTEEYKDYVQAERALIGDTIRVYVPKLDADIKVRVVEKRYNILTQETTELTLSNYIEPQSVTISQIANNLANLVVKNTDNLAIAKEYATTLIKSGLKNSYVVCKQDEIVIGDSKDINTMQNVWRFNKNGLAHSSTGYNGNFETAITSDGHIVADFIDTGVLSANLIKAGVLSAIKIQNQDGSFIMDLGSNNGLTCKKNGQNSLSIEGNKINFYKFDDGGKYSGTIGTSTVANDSTKQGIQMYHNKNSYLSLGYLAGDGLVHSYIDFDEAQVIASNKRSINFWKNMMMHDGVCLYVGDNDNCYITGSADNGIYIQGNVYATGTLGSGGGKTRVVDTTQGKVGVNAFETAECFFADIKRGKLINGECTINIEPLFLETVNTDIEYEVKTWCYGKGQVWVQTDEMFNDHFIVRGENDIEFGYEIIAKQKGYENTRLQKINIGDEKVENI